MSRIAAVTTKKGDRGPRGKAWGGPAFSPLLACWFLVACGGEELGTTRELAVNLSNLGRIVHSEPLQTNHVLAVPGTDRVIAVHRQHITILDTAGVALARFGRDGIGPGEFQSTTSAGVVADSIWIWDQAGGRLTVVDVLGMNYRMSPLPLRGRPSNGPVRMWSGMVAGVGGDGRILGYADGAQPAPDVVVSHLAVARHPETVERILLTSVHRPDCLVANRGRPVMLLGCQRNLVFVAPDGQSATAVERDRDIPGGMLLRVTRVAVDGDTVLDARTPFPAREMSDSLLEALAAIASRPLSEPVDLAGFRPPARVAPVLWGLQGNDGSLWLASNTTSQGQRWFLVTPAGTLAGELFLDRDLTIGAVARDGAWAVRDLENGDAELVRITILP